MSQFISIDDSKYPELLKFISDPPGTLYYKGDPESWLFNNCLAVVGSRRMTTYGRRVTDKIVYDIAAGGVTIVSGFMYGIDATAHKAALTAGGVTIAVMPCGIDLVHPRYQGDLYKDIIDGGGLIISEYAGVEEPKYWTYPKRNRIIAGLSGAVLVVEAAKNSGSLITARLAKKYNRKLLAVPGSIFSANSVGTLGLIKEGAAVVNDSGSVFDAMGIKRGGVEHVGTVRIKDKLQLDIVELISHEPLNIDEVARRIEVSSGELGSKITELELLGYISEEGGKYYVN